MNHEYNPPLTDEELVMVEQLRSRTNVANRVASYRVKMGLTQDELGRRAKSKQARISEIESLRGNVRFDTLDRIARELGLMIDLVPRSQPEPSIVVHNVRESTLAAADVSTGPLEFDLPVSPDWTRAS
jgi:transcriptional regulator with XRE-family HTH domain